MKTLEHRPGIDINQIMKLRINGTNKITRHGSHDLTYKDAPEIRFTTRNLWREVRIYEYGNLDNLLQTLKIDRAKRLIHCPLCEEWVKKVFFVSRDTDSNQYVCHCCLNK